MSDAPRLVLIEDDAGDRSRLSEALRANGVEAADLAACDAERGLTLLAWCADAETPPATIILDPGHPGDDARAVLACIRAHPVLRRVHLVLLTGDRSTLPEGDDLADECFLKPELWSHWLDLGASLRARLTARVAG